MAIDVNPIPNLVVNPLTGTVNIGGINIAHNYRWGIRNNQQFMNPYIPLITLKEYQQINGPMQEMFLYAGRVGLGVGEVIYNKIKEVAVNTGGTIVNKILPEGFTDEMLENLKNDTKKAKNEANRENAYANMYTTRFTGNMYILPYFSTFNHATSNTWEDGTTVSGIVDKFINVGGVGASDIGNMMTSLMSNSYVSIPKRKEFTGTNENEYVVRFQLYNTLAGSWEETYKQISKNLKFVYGLIYNNLPDRLSITTLRPPVLYNVNIAGVRYSPVAVIKNLVIENIGQVMYTPMLFGDERRKICIPDAWDIQITLQELLPESRNIYEGAFRGSGDRITVIDNTGDGLVMYEEN